MHRGLCFCLSLVPVLALNQQKAGPASSVAPRLHSEMLVSAQWLAEHLKDPNVVVLHVADDPAEYQRAHIPGARFLAMNKFVTKNGPLQVELPPVAQLQQTFSELGVGDDTRVILYATNWFPNAARAYFTLDYLGHGDKASLLDGGIEEWRAENRPVTSDAPQFSPASFTPHVQENFRALLDEVQRDVNAKPGEEPEQVVDTRPARRYTAGHLSGAVNLYWQDTLVSEERPIFQSPEKLRALYASRGLAPGRKIVTYCEVGLQASHGYFLAKYLGYEAAMYDGSYQEWSALNLPVVKGDSKR